MEDRLIENLLPQEDSLVVAKTDSIASDLDSKIDSTHWQAVSPPNQAFDENSCAIIRDWACPSWNGIVEEAGAGACRITPVAWERLR